ncbi:ABC transporter substrate-binding protein [Allocoleopsis franciscana]|uniref:ABC transporter substrate-binding protein n=1 Tax=Allocoleopsis franciscana TaxID=2886352 RepID=UPI0002E226F8
MPSDRVTAQALANYLSQQINLQTAVVFYNSGSQYSKSLQHQFRESLGKQGGNVVDELDLSTPMLNFGSSPT